eukprot:756095-Hanusia_phi.AAC.1
MHFAVSLGKFPRHQHLFHAGAGPPFLPPQRVVTAHLMKTSPPHLECKTDLSSFYEVSKRSPRRVSSTCMLMLRVLGTRLISFLCVPCSDSLRFPGDRSSLESLLLPLQKSRCLS